jgi:hypothetical protein
MKHIKKFESFVGFPINEAINKPLNEFGQTLEDKFKKAGFKTGVFQNMNDAQRNNARKKIEEDSSMILFNFQTGMNEIEIHFNRDKKKEFLKVINQFGLPMHYQSQTKTTKDGKEKTIVNSLNPGDLCINGSKSIEDMLDNMPKHWPVLKVGVFRPWLKPGGRKTDTKTKEKNWSY